MKLSKKVAMLALPLILSNITVPLLSLTNTYIAGHLHSAVLMAATALGGMLIDFLYWPFGFLRMSTVSWVAQAKGAQHPDDISRTINHGLFIALILGFFLIAVHPLMLKWALLILHGDPKTIEFASGYLHIRIWSAPAVMLNTVLIGAFIGQQDTKTPLWMTVSTNSVAVLLGLLFTFTFNLSINGIAWADVVGQYVGTLIGAAVLLRRQSVNLFNVELPFLRKFLVVNVDVFLRTCLMIVVYGLFTMASLQFGSKYLAANALIFDFLMLNSYLQDGFTNVAETLIGEQVGLKKTSFAMDAVWQTWSWMVLVAGLMIVIFVLFGRSVTAWMTNVDEVRDIVTRFLPMVSIIPLISAPCFLMDGVFIGAGQFRAMRNTMLLAFLGYFLMWMAFSYYQNWGLWLALVGFYVLRGVFMGAFFWWKHRVGQFFVDGEGVLA